MTGLLKALHATRGPLLLALDAVAWFLALVLLTSAWALSSGSTPPWSGLAFTSVLVTGLSSLVSLAIGDAWPRAMIGGRIDAWLVIAVAAVAGFWAGLINVLPFVGWVPPLVPLAGAPVAAVLQMGVRTLVRLGRERAVARLAEERGAPRTLVVGTGAAARQLVRSMLNDPEGRYRPVGFVSVDDTGGRSCGLPVIATHRDVATTVLASPCDLVVLAARRLDDDASRTVARAAQDAGKRVQTLGRQSGPERGVASVADLLDVLDREGERAAADRVRTTHQARGRWAASAPGLPVPPV